MKIAIFHDYLGSIGGGEKLVLELAKGLSADIYTTDINKNNLKRLNYKNIKIFSLGKCIQFPGLKQVHSSWIFHKAKLKNYDFYILSGNWSVFATKKHQPNLYYIHTPVRMFYDSYEHFKKIASWNLIPFLLWVKLHKYFLEKQFKYINKIVTNSVNVKNRIKKYHHRESKIIYPPIKKYKFIKYGDFWLSVNRIYPHKRIDLQIEVFKNLPNEKLIIVGGYMSGDHAKNYAKRTLSNLPKNIKYLGEVSEKALEDLYGKCKAFITTSENEDFGMTVLEAMSAGKAVIAVNEGGYKETMVNNKTGILVKPNSDDLTNAIKKISKNPKKYKNFCERRAKIFNINNFINGMKKEILSNIHKNKKI